MAGLDILLGWRFWWVGLDCNGCVIMLDNVGFSWAGLDIWLGSEIWMGFEIWLEFFGLEIWQGQAGDLGGLDFCSIGDFVGLGWTFGWIGDLVGLDWFGALAGRGWAGLEICLGLEIFVELGWVRLEIWFSWVGNLFRLGIWFGSRFNWVRPLVGFYIWLGWRFEWAGLVIQIGWRFGFV